MATAYNSMTVAEILAQVTRLSGLSDSADLLATKYAAITSAGVAACDYRNWWFLESIATFDTVADQNNYVLTGSGALTPESGSFAGIKAPTAVWYDTDSTGSRRPLQALGFKAYQAVSNLETQAGTTRTYTMYGGSADTTMYLHPTPNAVKEITVYYNARHPKIVAAADADLLIPGDYHWEVYVNGASWLLQHETTDPAALRGSPAFQETMRQMAANSMDEQDDTSNENYFYGGVGNIYPHALREGLSIT